jgi:hypothetical protein
MEDSKNLIQELLQGMELVRQLRIYLNVSSSSNETRELLIEKIISTFEKALEMVNYKGHVIVGESSQQKQKHTSETVAIRMLDSPPLSSSPRSEESDRDHNTPRKRYVNTFIRASGHKYKKKLSQRTIANIFCINFGTSILTLIDQTFSYI